MSNTIILNTDELDIIFCNRNKLYGAYTLRKYYPNRIKKALGFSLIAVSIFSAWAFIPTKKVSVPFKVNEITLGSTAVDKNKKAAEIPQKKVHKKITNLQKFTSNIAIVSIKDSTNVLDDITNKNIGVTTTVVNVKGSIISDPYPVEIDEGAEKETATYQNNLYKTPISNPDVQATYPGGTNELIKFLQKNLHTPADIAEDALVQVSVQFVVDFEGNLQHFKIIKDGGAAFNNEVIRVLQMMPKWMPGKKGGTNVPVYYTIPVKFTASE